MRNFIAEILCFFVSVFVFLLWEFGGDPRSFIVLFALRFLSFCGLDRYELEI